MLEEVTSTDVARLVIGLVEAWNAHDVERVVGYYTLDFEGSDVVQAKPQYGAKSRGRALERFIYAFPDVHFTTDDLVVQEGSAALLWTLHGTHRGTIMHIPPTGKKITIRGTSFLTLRGDKICKGVFVWDVAGMLRQFGLLPDL